MNKNNITMLVVIVLVLAGVVFWGKYARRNNAENGYSIVYLTTGEVYVGILKTFPDLELKNGYVLQITKDPLDPNKNNFQLNPINEALWAPETMHIIKENVVFYGPLLATSKIAETIAAGKK